MILKNDTIDNMVMESGEREEEQIQGVHQILDEELLQKIEQTEGVKRGASVNYCSDGCSVGRRGNRRLDAGILRDLDEHTLCGRY